MYKLNKERAVYRNNDPTLTDQSQARETDINIIVSKMGIGRVVAGAAQPPMYADFTDLPRDLRGFIEEARQLDTLRSKLPKELQGQRIEELLALTPEQIHALLFPEPATPPAPKE